MNDSFNKLTNEEHKKSQVRHGPNVLLIVKSLKNKQNKELNK